MSPRRGGGRTVGANSNVVRPGVHDQLCHIGYATAVFDAGTGIRYIRTTAESHRRIALVEVMGRQSGYIALGVFFGQPDFLLIPEASVNINLLAEQVIEFYDLQKNAVIVCGEGIRGEDGGELGAQSKSTDPAGNVVLSVAAEAVRRGLIERIEDEFSRVRRVAARRTPHFVRPGLCHTDRE